VGCHRLALGMLPYHQEKVRLGSERTDLPQAFVVAFGESMRGKDTFLAGTAAIRTSTESNVRTHARTLASPTTLKSGQEREHWISQ
jgi:hypothetical protein